ncbi:unnamed protein product [Caenorhabditis sp. 36 PRJEB53466]|nr:unnamed protein product [Caenorhabditis sp. 36 PRJEB53466]
MDIGEALPPAFKLIASLARTSIPLPPPPPTPPTKIHSLSTPSSTSRLPTTSSFVPTEPYIRTVYALLIILVFVILIVFGLVVAAVCYGKSAERKRRSYLSRTNLAPKYVISITKIELETEKEETEESAESSRRA